MMKMGVMEIAVILVMFVLLIGPGGLLLSPFAPLVNYSVSGILAFAIAVAIAAHLPGGIMQR